MNNDFILLALFFTRINSSLSFFFLPPFEITNQISGSYEFGRGYDLGRVTG